MGLIKAAAASMNSTLADQWKEYIICDSMSNDVLMQKGFKQSATKRTSNTKGSEDIISDGSIIAINEGQAMAVIQDGEIIEFSAESGVFKLDMKSEPSIFEGGFGKGLVNTFSTMGKRFQFGGDTGSNVKVYYFNTKELFGQKFGTPQPVLYDDIVYQSISIRFFGQTTLKLNDPITFYKNISGNVEEKFTITEFWEEQLQSEFLMYIGQAMALLAVDGIKYNQIPQQQIKISQYMNQILDEPWSTTRGLVVETVGISSVTLNPEDKEKIEKIDEMRLMSNTTNAAGRMAAATANALENAADNENGAMMGFAGLNMAMGAGGNQVTQMQQTAKNDQEAQVQAQVHENNGWNCECGNTGNTGKFCSNCGKTQPQATTWDCACGQSGNTGKFCSNCGKAEPQDTTWDCACGQFGNPGKFCSNCGKSQS